MTDKICRSLGTIRRRKQSAALKHGWDSGSLQLSAADGAGGGSIIKEISRRRICACELRMRTIIVEAAESIAEVGSGACEFLKLRRSWRRRRV
jgi:hypothetical protein